MALPLALFPAPLPQLSRAADQLPTAPASIMLRITKLLLALTGLLALWATLLSRPGLVEPQRSLVLWVSEAARGGRERRGLPTVVGGPPSTRAAAGGRVLTRSRPALPPAQSPLLLILLFGAYSAVALLYGVATFRTVPEEAEALAKVRARLELRLLRPDVYCAPGNPCQLQCVPVIRVDAHLHLWPWAWVSVRRLSLPLAPPPPARRRWQSPRRTWLGRASSSPERS